MKLTFLHNRIIEIKNIQRHRELIPAFRLELAHSDIDMEETLKQLGLWK